MALTSRPLRALLVTMLSAGPLQAQRIAIPAAALTDSAALDAANPRLAEQTAAAQRDSNRVRMLDNR